jgi:hypothetical protein
MTDTTTQKPLRVADVGTRWPYIRLPLAQLEQVKRLLDSHGVRYMVEENAYSYDNGPFYIRIDIRREEDAAAVQAILDSAAE